MRRRYMQKKKNPHRPVLVLVPTLGHFESVKRYTQYKKPAKKFWSDTAHLLGRQLREKKDKTLDKQTPNLKIVNITIRFAEAIERLENKR